MLSQPDSQFVKRNKRLPGLGFLLDTGIFSEYVEKSFPDLKIDTNDTGYVRYKPGTNCLVSYRTRYNGTQGYLYATTYAAHCLGKLKKAKSELSRKGDVATNRVLVDEFFSVVSLFPFDRKLGSLHNLFDKKQKEGLFEELLPGRGDGSSFTLTSMRYKPERRFVGKLIDRNIGKTAGVVKLYRKPDFKAARVAAKSFASRGNLVVPKLLSSSTKNHALVFEWECGKPLKEIINKEEFNPAHLKDIATALREIHLTEAPNLPKITPPMESKCLTDTASMLSLTIPTLGKKATLLAVYLSDLLKLKRQIYTPVHGDFYAGQVLLGKGERVAVVDFDRAALGDPARDVGTFFAHLERDFIRINISYARLTELKNSFLSGYLNGDTEDFTLRVAIYTAVELFRLSQEPFRQRESEWTNITHSLLSRVGSLIDELKDVTAEKSFSVQISDPYHILKNQPYSILEDALTPSIVEKGLRECMYSHLSEPRIQAIKVVRYKLLRHCLLEYRLAPSGANDVTPLSLMGKIRCRGLDIRSYLVQNKLWNGKFGHQSDDEILVPEPVGIIPDLNMLLYKKADGIPITGILPTDLGNFVARQAARAAHKIHTSSISPQRVHTLTDEIRTLEEKLRLVMHENPGLRKQIIVVLDLSKTLAASLPKPVLRPVHRNFTSDQILAGKTNVFLLDFDLFALGDPALDIGSFVGNLREQSLRIYGEPDMMCDIVHAFSAEYLKHSERDIRRSIDGYALLTMARHIYVSTLFRERRRLTLPLIELCETELKSFINGSNRSS